MKLSDVTPGNIDHAMAYYVECRAKGTWSPDKAQALCMLWENPLDVVNAIRRMSGLPDAPPVP